MKTIKNLFDKIIDFENLYMAWESARKGKRYREEIMIFSDNLEANLIDIQNHLIYGTYKVGKYRPFYIYEPKKRLIMALPFRDRVVQWAIYRQLFPILNRQFIFDSYACRPGKGTQKAVARLQYWLRQTSRKPQKYYYLKLDIAKYFYRVDHRILEDILRRKIKDKRLVDLLVSIINSEEMKFGLPVGIDPDKCAAADRLANVGMPIGNLTSQMFANLYLHELDMFAKHELRLHYYIRYMDDIIILHSDKKYLQEVKDAIETFLFDNLRLQLNKKTAIRPCGMGIEFVGYRVWATHRKLKRKTALKIKHAVKGIKNKWESGAMTQEAFDRRIASYKGLLTYCNSYGLRKKLNKMFRRKPTKKQRK
ncbi:MAG: reverse transcriptase/maturase family protein [Eubacterium sp.]|nr:reverse transcriptase/maturase family protein [Eubacterium sp.]